MYDTTTSTRTAVAPARPTSWWRALWYAASAGPATPVLQAMAGPNGALLWSGTSRALTERLISVDDDVCADEYLATPAGVDSPAAITHAEELCRAA